MDKRKFRRGLTTEATSYDHLRGKMETEAMLEDLGIDIGYRLGPLQIMCHCPDVQGNHQNGDANPSFGFNEEKMAYNCFVCGGGNIIELVQMMRPELDDEEALRYLESFSDLTHGSQDDLVNKLQGILNPVAKEEDVMPEYPDTALFPFKKIHPYLYERGLTKEIIVEMQVGFDDEHCGIIIPHWFQGKLRGWQVRHLAQDGGQVICDYCEREQGVSMAKGKKVGKYINTRHFPKKTTLYGYDRLKQKIQEGTATSETVIIVESPMTALKLMSQGHENVLSSFGQFSAEQGMLLLPFSHVIFWPDNDFAGEQNVQRAIDVVARYTRLSIVPVVDIPKGDAADLRTRAVIDYLQLAYSSSLFPMLYEQYGLPTIDEVPNEFTTKSS